MRLTNFILLWFFCSTTALAQSYQYACKPQYLDKMKDTLNMNFDENSISINLKQKDYFASLIYWGGNWAIYAVDESFWQVLGFLNGGILSADTSLVRGGSVYSDEDSHEWKGGYVRVRIINNDNSIQIVDVLKCILN